MSNTKDKVKEFYSNDIVYKFNKNKRITFGVVVDSYEGSSDVDEYSLHKGQIRVCWSTTSREQVWNQSKVSLMNRAIIPGDIVRRLVKGKETQRGYCKETKQLVTLQIVGTDRVIEHVTSDRLHRLRPFLLDDTVSLDRKVGTIENIEQMVVMQSKCGSVVEVILNQDLDDYWLSKRNRFSLGFCYPGQEIVCVPASLNQPNWIKKSKSMKRNMQSRQRFTVQTVQEVFVEVAWANSTNLTELTQDEVNRLQVLENPTEASLELNDRRLLKLTSRDSLISKKDWTKKMSLLYRPEVVKVRHMSTKPNRMPKTGSGGALVHHPLTGDDSEDDWWTEDSESTDDQIHEGPSENSSNTSIASRSPAMSGTIKVRRCYPPKTCELIPGSTLPVEVICVESRITVVWQDGLEEKEIPSVQLYYSISLDDHEFFPGEWVVKDSKVQDDNYGVVQYVNYLERTASVKWFIYSPNDDVVTEGAVVEMSVYDLKKHSKFLFRPGSIVRTMSAELDKVGKVIDSCTEGHVQVQWLDGSSENCRPQDLDLVMEPDQFDYSDEDDSSADDFGGTGAGGESWETESIESYAGDITDEAVLQSMASRLDFVRSRIVYLKEVFQTNNDIVTENFSFLKDLLLVYDNSSYLDKLLGTSFFSSKNKHFQCLLAAAKERAKSLGIELRGRLFNESGSTGHPTGGFKVAEKDNINKIIKMEYRVYAEIGKKDARESSGANTSPNSDDKEPTTPTALQTNLCVELLSMLKYRMDLVYAEIISRIGGTQALSVLTLASAKTASSTPKSSLASVPTTPDDCPEKPFKIKLEPELIKDEAPVNDSFCILDEAPSYHHYFSTKCQASKGHKFIKTVAKEIRLLRESLPPDVWVRAFSDRADLMSVMIRGPAKTPYEDGLFLFDIKLGPEYPQMPPIVHYISYSSERLNPNLYVEGKVCVSLLGTWMGRGTEIWGPNSTLLQLIVSIQGLILVAEPYYNEAGYEKQTDTQQGYENSRTYNELVILKLVQSMSELLLQPPEVFKPEVLQHFEANGEKLCKRLEKYCDDSDPLTPDFPLLPVSKGLKLSLAASMNSFKDVLHRVLAANAS